MRTCGNRRVHLFGLKMQFFAARCERRAQYMSPVMAQSRPFAATQHLGRFRSEADIGSAALAEPDL